MRRFIFWKHSVISGQQSNLSLTSNNSETLYFHRLKHFQQAKIYFMHSFTLFASCLKPSFRQLTQRTTANMISVGKCEYTGTTFTFFSILLSILFRYAANIRDTISRRNKVVHSQRIRMNSSLLIIASCTSYLFALATVLLIDEKKSKNLEP